VEGYRTEEEQVEALKRWWKENGQSTVIGIVLAVGAVFGWRTYQDSQAQAAANASHQYQQMIQALTQEETLGAEPARQLATAIRDAYSGSTYAQFASLHLARMAVGDGDLESAEAALRDVLASASSGDEMHQVASLRLARVLAARGDVTQALEILQGGQGGFASSFAIARGDVLLGAGREGEALIAYELAAGMLDAERPLPRSLQDKIQYLTARQSAAAAEAG
jgi:predicted negative regulator of RcsB-dependent stress response